MVKTNINEFKKLQSTEKNMDLIDIDNLENKSDRTLLYGYTSKGETWHVYIKNNTIWTVSYKQGGEIEYFYTIFNEHYIPSGKLYPESCDFEFCKLLKKKDIDLPFIGRGEEWQITKESAIKRANEMREKKIKSLEKQIEKLKCLKFE